MTEEYVGTLVYDQGTPVPSLDLGQPIVRCRDCELYEDMAFMLREVPVCKRFGEGWRVTEPDGFCAWGRRTHENH